MTLNLMDLPLHVKEEMALNLRCDDVARLMRTNRAWYEVLSSNFFWRRYVARHTPLTDLAPSSNFREVYKVYFLDRYKMAVADMSVIWLNGYYLHKQDEIADSLTGSIIFLESVCWLHIKGSFTDVYPGVYDVVWRMKVNDELHVDGDTTITTSCGGREMNFVVVESDWSKWRRTYGVDTWFEAVTGRVRVKQKGTVSVCFANHKNWWKSGIYWDYVQLRPVLREKDKTENVTSSPKEQSKRK